MWVKRCLILPGLALIAACGTSRSTRNGTCSSTKAVVDTKVAPGTTPEAYDPTAALLLFKATADRVSIESRCNARLVNKMQVKHKRADGSLEDAKAPIDFPNLKLVLETGESNFELHTSAHCFFRVWDPRVDHQVAVNPLIGVEPFNSLLKDTKNRYQLYRSLLTTPQTLVVYLPNRTPVTFKYKLETTGIYEQFFSEVDKQNSPELERVVGRELTKSSVILDELVMHECNSSRKIENRVKLSPELGQVSNAISLLALFGASPTITKFDRGRGLDEYLRTEMLSSGRHKVCFSQTDMIIASVTFTEPLTNLQNSALSEITKTQSQQIAKFEALQNGQSEEKFIFQLKPGTATSPLPTPNGLTTCSFSNSFPGFSLSDPLKQRLEISYLSKWDFESIDASASAKVLEKVFPNFKPNPLEAVAVKPIFNAVVQAQKCEISELHFDSKTLKCGERLTEEIGRCPLSLAEAEREHKVIANSVNVATASPFHLYRRFSEESSMALTLPLTAFRDFLDYSCGQNGNTKCPANSEAEKLQSILNNLDSLTVKTSSGRLVNPTVAHNEVMVTGLDADEQFICEYRNKSTLLDTTSNLFNNWSQSSYAALSEGLDSGVKNANYNRFATRFLYLKCPAAGFQRLYRNGAVFYGLAQSLKLSDVTLVHAHSNVDADPSSMSNTRMVETGIPSRVPLMRLFFNESVSKEPATEIAARLLGGPHLQVSYCNAQNGNLSSLSFCDKDTLSADDFSTISGELQKVPAHIYFTTQVPQWLPQSLRTKYGPISAPTMNYSADSARYYFTAGDSGTTLSAFGLFPIMMLSTVMDNPVSGGLAVIPSAGGQKVQSSKNADCR